MEAVHCIAIGACVKLRGDIDMASGLVDDAYGTVVEIKVHTIKVTLHYNKGCDLRVLSQPESL